MKINSNVLNQSFVLENFVQPVIYKDFYYIITNRHNINKIVQLIQESKLKFSTNDICNLMNMKNNEYSKLHFSNRIIYSSQDFLKYNSRIRNINSSNEKYLVVLPKILINQYVSDLKNYFNKEVNVLFDKNYKENDSNIHFINYHSLFKLIPNIENYNYSFLQCIELQANLSESSFRNLLIKNANLPKLIKNLYYISHKIPKFQAELFTVRCKEEIFIINELFNCDFIINNLNKFVSFNKPESSLIVNEEILNIKQNLFDF